MSHGTSNYPTPSDFASNQISLDTWLAPIRAQTQLLASVAAASIKVPPHPLPPIVVTANRGERRAATTTNSLSSCQAAIKRKYNMINFTLCMKKARKKKMKPMLSRSKINAVCSKGGERGAGPSNCTANNKSTA